MEKGLNSINRELEIDHFLKKMKVINVALKTLFTRAERFLLQNNKTFILHTESDSGPNSSTNNKKLPSNNSRLG